MSNIFYILDEINETARNVLPRLHSKTIAVKGEMGAGKTTLIKALVKALGGQDAGSSPSFGLVNEYHKANGELLGYHFDFYRIEDPAEALDMGLEDYLEQDCWIFMEWPEKIGDLLPPEVQELQLHIEGPEHRRLEISQA